MSTPENPDSELSDQALLLWNAISIQALQDLVTKVADTVLHFEESKSKSAGDYLRRRRDANIRNLARFWADLDPAKASRLQEMLLKMNGGPIL